MPCSDPSFTEGTAVLLHKLRSVSTVAVGVRGGSKGCRDLSSKGFEHPPVPSVLMWESCGRAGLSWCWSSRGVSLRQGCGQSSCGAGFWGAHHHGGHVDSSPEVSGCRDGFSSAVAQQQLLPFLGLSQG